MWFKDVSHSNLASKQKSRKNFYLYSTITHFPNAPYYTPPSPFALELHWRPSHTPEPQSFFKLQCGDLPLLPGLICSSAVQTRSPFPPASGWCLFFPTFSVPYIIQYPGTSWQFLPQRAVDRDPHPLLHSLNPCVHRSLFQLFCDLSDSPHSLFPAP